MRIIFWTFLIPVLMFSCQNEQGKDFTNKHFQQQWIKPNLWISELNEYYNFPNWFDDSLILAHTIQTINRKEFYVHYADGDTLNLKDSVPDKWITYQFDNSGKILSVTIKEFNNYLLFHEKMIYFQPKTVDTTTGYTSFQLKTSSLRDAKKINTKQYLTHSKSDNYSAYYNPTSDNYLYLIGNPNVTSPISIDTMLSPSTKDILVIPNLIRPQKIYSVDNKILESNVLEFYYDEYGNLKKYRFRQKSSKTEAVLRYNNEGFLIGFDKLIYSDNHLISRKKETIKINNIGQPLLLYEKTPKSKPKKVVEFTYEQASQTQ